VDDEVRRPRDGYISGADDMLNDFDETDRRDDGVLTASKIDSIKQSLSYGGIFADPAYLAGNFCVSIEDVNLVIAEAEGSKIA